MVLFADEMSSVCVSSRCVKGGRKYGLPIRPCKCINTLTGIGLATENKLLIALDHWTKRLGCWPLKLRFTNSWVCTGHALAATDTKPFAPAWAK